MFTIDDYRRAYGSGASSPSRAVAEVYRRIRAWDDPALFIALRPEEEVAAEAAALEAGGGPALPLWGIPVAVKDNIDVAGLPTSAACPAFAYRPARDATAVARLRAAGAIVIGKTNLDQFATGLVGTRSPHGAPRNAVRPDLIPGGSSSGSASAVAAGIVPVALGTDTAGSGRVPAMVQNIVGLKPSLGLVPSTGAVPACRTLDCVSVFALTVEDAWTALAAMAGPDPADPYSRDRPPAPERAPGGTWRVGVPDVAGRIFSGDANAPAAFEAALARLEGLGATLVEIDLAPFLEAARLLYGGPWLAERWLVVADLLARDPGAIHPVTREIVAPGGALTAADAFRAMYRLQEIRRQVGPVLDGLDALAVPTAPRLYTLAEIAADPIRPNADLGTYTNFVNLLDLCGLALPGTMSRDGRPYGITLLAPGGRDADLLEIGRRFQAATDLPLGATGARPGPSAARTGTAPRPADDAIPVAFVGAHMAGLPLNRDVTAAGGAFLEEVDTAPLYRLFLLPGGPPRRPGLLRVVDGSGEAIRAELWSLPAASLGRLVAAIPAPLGIGRVTLADGREVPGFLAEAAGVTGARDITASGGWRAFLAEETAPALQPA